MAIPLIARLAMKKAAAKKLKGKVKGEATKFFKSKPVQFTIVGIVVLIVVIIMAKRAAHKGKEVVTNSIKKAKEARFDRNSTEPPNELAVSYRNAFNPSGYKWMIDWDGTTEDAVTALAYRTQGIKDQVAAAYKEKYSETLLDRMNSELDSREVTAWSNIVGA